MMKRSVIFSALAIFTLLVCGHVALAQDESNAEVADSTDAPTTFEARTGAEKFEFQAEVSRLMDIIINSIYSNKDIFLRELISNASDALDKIRFLSLTDPDILGEGEQAELDIKITIDKEKKVITIKDSGVGMTRDDLINNLGTIARSGTSGFLEQLQKGGDISLIGQFGVGFYSVYLVADYVEVISKHNSDAQYIWESSADGNFSVSEDENGEALERGTMIRIHLKDETAEYANEQKLRSLVERYSEFINFPIYLWTSKTVDVEVPADEDDADDEAEEYDEDEEEDEEDDDVDDDEEDEEEELPRTKIIKQDASEWTLLNDNRALWLRPAGDIEDEEYDKFFKSMKKTTDAPMAHTHFRAEGDVEFKSILYVPAKAPADFFDNYYNRLSDLKLYVRRVFISDDFSELLPKYLSFLTGIVDSDTLPLNVSRETLQQHSSLKTIKKKLVRKALDMFRKLAEADKKDEGDDDDTESEETEVKEYDSFWNEYGKAIKLGIIEDSANRVRLAKLLRFHTSQSPDTLVSLDEYVARMKEGQKNIYYLAGTSMEEVKNSSFLEKLLQKGFEVIFFTDPVDEYAMQNLTEYDDIKFQNASKEDLKFGDNDDKDKKAFKVLKEDFKPFTDWWKDLLSSDVEAVKVSKRLSTSPCVVVTSKYGWSANMERIMHSQAMAGEQNAYMRGKKTLEINAYHPLIMGLKEKFEEDPVEQEDVAKLIFETSMLESGFAAKDTKSYAQMVMDVIGDNLGIDISAAVIEPLLLEDDDADDEAEVVSHDEL